MQHSSLDQAFIKDPSDVSMVNSDHLAIKLALAASLATMIPTPLVKNYKNLNAEKALEMAGNILWTSSNEDHGDVSMNR